MRLLVLTTLTLALSTGCSHNQPLGQSAAALPVPPAPVPSSESIERLDFPIIDAHMHFDHPEKTHAQPAAEMLAKMSEAGIRAAVVHFEAGESDYTKVDRTGPVKFAICAAVVPGAQIREIDAGIVSGKYQCLKIYLGYVPKWATDRFYIPYYKMAEHRKVPVVFHTGDTYTKNVPVKFADPLQIDEIAIQYPSVKFVIAHMGNPWIHSAAEVVYKNDNVYTDVSAFILGNAATTDPVVIDELVVKPIRWFFIYVQNPKKILFGSDWPLLEIAPYVEAVQRAIPKQHWRAVFHDNAAELFGLQ
jgi:uncharacterized protein